MSGYRWEDGIGPKQERPRRLDLAWHSTETNEFGLHEMAEWLEATGGNELMEAVNLGTRGLQEALDLLEYANVPGGTELSERRRANGADKPFDIRMWCLGNEMDGPWQLGHKSAEDYGMLAASVAAGMRQIDPDVELVVCGSSAHGMSTFGKWEQTVLEKTYENVNFVSCHAYYQPFFKEDGTRDMASFLASGVDMDGFIKDVAATIDATKAHLKSAHDVYISFDEWNVWYQGEGPSKTPEGIGNWPVAPRLLEDIYTAADAVVFGDLMITLLKNADRVRAASLAQLVNVIAPIMTEPGGPAWRQTTFHPFSVTARLAKGGTVLEPKLSAGTVDTPRYGEVDGVNAVAVRCADGSLYTGMTPDIARRLRQHVEHLAGCAKYTRSHPVTALALLLTTDTATTARQLEARIKRLTRAQKDALIADPARLPALCPALAGADIRPVPDAQLADYLPNMTNPADA